MSIFAKTTIPIVLMAAVLAVASFYIQRHLIFPAFATIERDSARDQIDRVVRRIEAQLETIEFTVYDWSAWDDTYEFSNDLNQRYVTSNLQPDTFENFGYEVALMMDRNGNSLWAGVFDYRSGDDIIDRTESHLSELLAAASDYIEDIDLSADVDDQRISGVFPLKGVPVLFSMRPIVRSDGTGEPGGFLLFGQFLDQHRINTLAEQILMSFELSLPSETQKASDNSRYQIKPIDDSRLMAEKSIYIDGEPALNASTEVTRSISQLGKSITRYGMLLFIILGVAIAITLFIVFQITVVRPIRDLRTDIASITGTMDYSMRAQIRNQDEIGALSRDFNTMLGLIEANNQELKQLSETDPLTGLFNRLAMDKKLQQAWQILTRTGDSLALMLIDIDDFKAYNDHYGHQAGDDCLKKVAQILQNAAKRDSDMVARYGGEEFLIVLPGTSQASAQDIAAVLQQHIAEENIEHSASSVDSRVTVSIGIAAQVPSPAESVSGLIGAADRALYRAKENGRNRIE